MKQIGYHVNIVKVTREMVNKREYVGTDVTGTDSPYVDNQTEEDVSREIYSQLVSELDLVPVINAINTPPAVTAKDDLHHD